MDRPGSDNIAAKFLSHLNIGQGSMATPVLDDFPDEAQFAISSIIPWFDDVSN